jgi:hypothetical protein
MLCPLPTPEPANLFPTRESGYLSPGENFQGNDLKKPRDLLKEDRSDAAVFISYAAGGLTKAMEEKADEH